MYKIEIIKHWALQHNAPTKSLLNYSIHLLTLIFLQSYDCSSGM